MYLLEVIKRIEEHKGRKLDLTDRRDFFRLSTVLEREIRKRNAVISGIQDVLNGDKTYDPKEQKAINLSDRER